jgi:hypothetical protein
MDRIYMIGRILQRFPLSVFLSFWKNLPKPNFFVSSEKRVLCSSLQDDKKCRLRTFERKIELSGDMMDTSLILSNISKHISLDERERDFFMSLLDWKKYKAKQFLLREGDVCRFLFFVNKGCLRGFTTDRNGFEHVLNFAPPDWWMADLYSLITQKTGDAQHSGVGRNGGLDALEAESGTTLRRGAKV